MVCCSILLFVSSNFFFIYILLIWFLSLFFSCLEISTTHLAQELLTNLTVQWWLKKFCKGEKSLEDEEHSSQPLEVDSDELQVIIIKADPLSTTWEVSGELSADYFMAIQHSKQIGNVKKCNKWVPHELTRAKKKKKKKKKKFL